MNRNKTFSEQDISHDNIQCFSDIDNHFASAKDQTIDNLKQKNS